MERKKSLTIALKISKKFNINKGKKLLYQAKTLKSKSFFKKSKNYQKKIAVKKSYKLKNYRIMC